MNKIDKEFKIMECDTPNMNGRTYTRDAVENMIEDYQKKIKLGNAYGRIGAVADMYLNPEDISHIVTDIKIDDNGNVMSKIKIMDTPQGKILEDIIGHGMKLSTVGVGKLDDGYVTEFSLKYTCFLHEDE